MINSRLKINEVALTDAIQSEYANMGEYVEYTIFPEREDARLLSIIVAPLVLRISIECVVVDVTSEGFSDKIVTEFVNARVPGFEHRLPDALNFHDRHLCVLFKPGHYDIIYPSEYVCRNHGRLILTYDAPIRSPDSDNESLPPPISQPQPF
jgi:hypothetical protein